MKIHLIWLHKISFDKKDLDNDDKMMMIWPWWPWRYDYDDDDNYDDDDVKEGCELAQWCNQMQIEWQNSPFVSAQLKAFNTTSGVEKNTNTISTKAQIRSQIQIRISTKIVWVAEHHGVLQKNYSVRQIIICPYFLFFGLSSGSYTGKFFLQKSKMTQCYSGSELTCVHLAWKRVPSFGGGGRGVQTTLQDKLIFWTFQ